MCMEMYEMKKYIGCDGCKEINIPTEKFIGNRGHYLLLCYDCYKKLVRECLK